MVVQYAFLINSDACSGCKTCQVACKDAHDIPAYVHWRRVYEITAGEWRQENGAWTSTVAAYNLSMACNHCMNPVCAVPCPTQAIWKTENGIVLIDESSCRNCRLCEPACPYGAIRFHPVRNTMTKCDFCVDLLEQGLPPACVTACPNRALGFGEYTDLKRRYGDVSRVYPLPDPAVASPALIIIPHRHSALVEGRSPVVANGEEL
jgi:anaerobic dimethyl sulfoxide reductase subunit B (iron-sulfur subunit)